MPLPLVPRKQHIGKAVIGESRDRQQHRIAEQRGQPGFARRGAPDGDHHVGADEQAAGFIDRVKATADVVERGAMGGERFGLFVDVVEGDFAGADGGEELVALPVDAGVADGATRVVPDDQTGAGHGISLKGCRAL
jgi:hypothetical protein